MNHIELIFDVKDSFTLRKPIMPKNNLLISISQQFENVREVAKEFSLLVTQFLNNYIKRLTTLLSSDFTEKDIRNKLCECLGIPESFVIRLYNYYNSSEDCLWIHFSIVDETGSTLCHKRENGDSYTLSTSYILRTKNSGGYDV